MFDLVIWSGSVALAPWALGLAWRLIGAIAVWMGPAISTGSAVFPRGPARHRTPAIGRDARPVEISHTLQ